MIKKVLILFILATAISYSGSSQQFFFRTSDLFPREVNKANSGQINIYQDSSMDTLLSRSVYAHKKIKGGDMPGVRIQIYRSGTRNARSEAEKTMAEFINDFPDIPPYLEYEEPGYFLVRVGDYRSKMESTKYLSIIRKKYPNAYTVPCPIKFPDLNK